MIQKEAGESLWAKVSKDLGRQIREESIGVQIKPFQIILNFKIYKQIRP